MILYVARTGTVAFTSAVQNGTVVRKIFKLVILATLTIIAFLKQLLLQP